MLLPCPHPWVLSLGLLPWVGAFLQPGGAYQRPLHRPSMGEFLPASVWPAAIMAHRPSAPPWQKVDKVSFGSADLIAWREWACTHAARCTG
jgi:hypothetical protein